MTYLSVFYTVLILGGGASPGITIIPDNAYISEQKCGELVAFWKSEAPQMTDIVTGRPISSAFYTCVQVNEDDERVILEQASKSGDRNHDRLLSAYFNTGGEPTVTLTHGAIYPRVSGGGSHQACDQEADRLAAQGPIYTDPVTGEDVTLAFFHCLPTDVEWSLELLGDATP